MVINPVGEIEHPVAIMPQVCVLMGTLGEPESSSPAPVSRRGLANRSPPNHADLHPREPQGSGAYRQPPRPDLDRTEGPGGLIRLMPSFSTGGVVARAVGVHAPPLQHYHSQPLSQDNHFPNAAHCGNSTFTKRPCGSGQAPTGALLGPEWGLIGPTRPRPLAASQSTPCPTP